MKHVKKVSVAKAMDVEGCIQTFIDNVMEAVMAEWDALLKCLTDKE